MFWPLIHSAITHLKGPRGHASLIVAELDLNSMLDAALSTSTAEHLSDEEIIESMVSGITEELVELGVPGQTIISVQNLVSEELDLLISIRFRVDPDAVAQFYAL